MSNSFVDAATVRERDCRSVDTTFFGDCNLKHDILTVRSVAGAGRGWVASQSLEPGTELWSETPLSFAPSRDALVQKVDAMLFRHENLCRQRHATSKGEGVVASNFFDMGSMGAYLFEQTSLLNHACCPNATMRVDLAVSCASDVRACTSIARRVEAGEQILISYSAKALFLPTAARRVLLRSKWGFWCKCARCEGTLPAVEKERWALLEEAAAAADACGKPRPAQVDREVAALQARASEMLASWMPGLCEGERFSEDAVYYGGGEEVT